MMRAEGKSLAVVHAARQNREETEERALAAAGVGLGQARALAEQAHRELSSFTASRRKYGECVGTGLDHREREEIYRALKARLESAHIQIRIAEERQQRQMQIYLESHSDCETIKRLIDGRAAKERDNRQRREQRRSEDLFLARRGARRDTHTASPSTADERYLGWLDSTSGARGEDSMQKGRTC